MCNSHRPSIVGTQNLLGGCLLALQMYPVSGMIRGPFGIFAHGPTPTLLRHWFICCPVMITVCYLFVRHVSFMQICVCHIFRTFQQSAHIAYFFPHKLAFSTAILILFLFPLPISITFCYLNRLVANRMAPSMWNEMG